MKRDLETSDILLNETLDGEPIEPAVTESPAESVTSNKPLKSSVRKGAAPHKRPPVDKYIWGIYLGLLFVSIIELYSASSSEVTGSNIFGPLIRHCIFLGVGFALVIGLQHLHYGYFSRFAWFFTIVSFLLLLIATFFGADINGAQRAIIIGGFTIQPPEIVKLTVLVLLATILGRNQRPGGVSTGAVLLVALIVLAFGGLLWINGLTNMIIMMIVSISMFLIGGIQWRKLGMVAVLYGFCLIAMLAIKSVSHTSTEYDSVGNVEQTENIGRTATHEGRMSRYLRGVHPEDPIDDYNRQVIFANMAQANGGFIGPGPGHSRESSRLPLAFSDYIFSIIVEDLGFVGGAALLLLYLFLLGRAGRIAYRCKRAFPAFLIMGCAVLIVSQALVHMAIVTGVAPVSGQPLPFISKGGTSIIVMSMAIGIMLSVSRYAVTSTDKKANKEELSKLSDGMQAANFSSQQ
ncbi:MAG: FtsW/RodA/SpoVE family cell cycle protein [Muribaculaceae bacterium]|nr:FtsW/RodA/SpoVE family cell cycle protein [Muribaculaceae bacterium]